MKSTMFFRKAEKIFKKIFYSFYSNGVKPYACFSKIEYDMDEDFYIVYYRCGREDIENYHMEGEIFLHDCFKTPRDLAIAIISKLEGKI